MCWFVNFRLIGFEGEVLRLDTSSTPGEKPKKKKGNSWDRLMALSPFEKLLLKHSFYPKPQEDTYWLLKGICSCSCVEDGNHLTEESAAYLLDLLALPEVKSVEVGWHWCSALPEVSLTEKIKITGDEFARQNRVAELKPDQWYRIIDPRKFEREP